MKRNSVRWAKKQWELVEAKTQRAAEDIKRADSLERALVDSADPRCSHRPSEVLRKSSHMCWCTHLMIRPSSSAWH